MAIPQKQKAIDLLQAVLVAITLESIDNNECIGICRWLQIVSNMTFSEIETFKKIHFPFMPPYKPGSMYWFSTYDFQSRINLLQKRINELTKQLAA